MKTDHIVIGVLALGGLYWYMTRRKLQASAVVGGAVSQQAYNQQAGVAEPVNGAPPPSSTQVKVDGFVLGYNPRGGGDISSKWLTPGVVEQNDGGIFVNGEFIS